MEQVRDDTLIRCQRHKNHLLSSLPLQEARDVRVGSQPRDLSVPWLWQRV
jgi:hypothetical protein